MENNKNAKKQNSLFVTLLVVIMTVAVVVAIAGAVAKNVSRTDDSITVMKRDDGTDSQKTAKNDKNAEDEVTESVETEPEETEAPVTDAPETDAKDVYLEQTPPQFMCPTDGKVIKDFSIDVPVFSTTMEDYRTHCGVDISAEPMSDVLCAADGTVSEIWDDPMMGKCVSVSHTGGAVSTYKNLAEDLPEGIEPGVSVGIGDVIGCVGDTALEEIAEESHLHFEIAVNGETVNPSQYVKFMNEENFSE